MERRNPAVGESDHLARISNTLREPGITKRVVQRRSKIVIQRRVIWIVWVTSVISVDPGLRPAAAHVAHNFSIWQTPRQPHGDLGHADTNLSLSNQRLVSVRQSLVKVWMLRNPRLRCCTTGENEHARREAQRRCAKGKPTLHGASKSYPPSTWQAKPCTRSFGAALPTPDSYRGGMRRKLFTGLMGVGAACVGRKQLCH